MCTISVLFYLFGVNLSTKMSWNFNYDRGSGTKNVIFQMALISCLSILTCSSRCQYDILKVLLKQIDQNPPVGYIKVAVGDLWWEKLLDFTGFPVVWCPWWLNDWFFSFSVFRSIQIDLKMIFWKCYLKKTMFTYHLVPNSSQIGPNIGKLGFFPVGEKLIAPWMQRIEYTVIHKTRRSKRELHNKVDK